MGYTRVLALLAMRDLSEDVLLNTNTVHQQQMLTVAGN
jgi:hypothetical protein